jgi:hypothetical protein
MRTDDVLKFSSLFKVNVCHDTEENVWVAYCEDMGSPLKLTLTKI